jgi:FkbM family methyltransferase
VEPLSEFAPFLAREASAAPERFTYVAAAAARVDGAVTLNVHKDLVGTSILPEMEGSTADGTPRVVSGITLDHLVDQHNAAGPYLLKVDAQGAELEILMGAKGVLADSELVVLETSLFHFLRGGPDFRTVIEFMGDAGFVPYDLWGRLYRPLDGALAQVDVAFAQEEGYLRTDHRYADADLRSLQDEQLSKSYRSRLKSLGRSDDDAG